MNPLYFKAFLGLMLGDGSVYQSQCSKIFEFAQSNVHSRYFLFVLNVFANQVTHLSTHKASKDVFQFHRLGFVVPQSLRTLWYPNGVKIVPAEIRLDPISIAHWLMDDGTLGKTETRILTSVIMFTKIRQPPCQPTRIQPIRRRYHRVLRPIQPCSVYTHFVARDLATLATIVLLLN
jgi:hypothetical protein